MKPPRQLGNLYQQGQVDPCAHPLAHLHRSWTGLPCGASLPPVGPIHCPHLAYSELTPSFPHVDPTMPFPSQAYGSLHFSHTVCPPVHVMHSTVAPLCLRPTDRPHQQANSLRSCVPSGGGSIRLRSWLVFLSTIPHLVPFSPRKPCL